MLIKPPDMVKTKKKLDYLFGYEVLQNKDYENMLTAYTFQSMNWTSDSFQQQPSIQNTLKENVYQTCLFWVLWTCLSTYFSFTIFG